MSFWRDRGKNTCCVRGMGVPYISLHPPDMVTQPHRCPAPKTTMADKAAVLPQYNTDLWSSMQPRQFPITGLQAAHKLLTLYMLGVASNPGRLIICNGSARCTTVRVVR